MSTLYKLLYLKSYLIPVPYYKIIPPRLVLHPLDGGYAVACLGQYLRDILALLIVCNREVYSLIALRVCTGYVIQRDYIVIYIVSTL